jgi:[ribosomal protein S5]-alanine N-acetyltransferase
VAHIAWDGPESESEFVAHFSRIAEEAAQGKHHFFVILDPTTRAPIGCCDVRPDDAGFCATLGIWLGEPFQGKGIGTRAIDELVRYAFGELGLHRLTAELFRDNWPSRRAFEKNGFALEGTPLQSTLKRGVPRDQWLLGLVNATSRFSPGTSS